MGGYPHIAHVISTDVDRLAQLKPGEEVRFRLVSLSEARHEDARRRQQHSDSIRRVATLANDA
jgi:allophanate hydrolase subunit 2